MEDTAPTLAQLREAAAAAVAQHGLNAAARDAWVSPYVLASVIQGKVPQPVNMRRLIRWWQRVRDAAEE